MKQTRDKMRKGVAFGIIAVLVSAMLLASIPTVSASASEELYGDANGDGTIDMRDLAYVKMIIFGKKPATELADANQDGRINVGDITRIKLIIVGKAPLPDGPLETSTVTVNAPEMVKAGGTFDTTIDVDNITDLNAAHFNLFFDSGVVKVTGVADGSLDGATIPVSMWDLVDANTIRVLLMISGLEGVNGSGYLAKVSFEVVGEAGDRSVLDIPNGMLVNNEAEEIPAVWIDDVVVIGPIQVNLTARQPRNVIVAGDDYTIEGTATDVGCVDIVLIGPDGYPLSDPGLDVLDGLEITSTSVTGDEFSEDITMPEGLDLGTWKTMVFSPGLDGEYGDLGFGAGELEGIPTAWFAGKTQDQIMAILMEHTIDVAGSDDLLELLTFEVVLVPGIDVNKTVWNPATGRWENSIVANVCDNLTFNCTIHARCCNLTNITVTDILSCSLNYTNNATVHYPNGTTARIEPEMSYYACNNTTLKWSFSGLNKSETITIIFQARVINKSGVDINVVNATGVCGTVTVSDEDEACINVPVYEAPCGAYMYIVSDNTWDCEWNNISAISAAPWTPETVHRPPLWNAQWMWHPNSSAANKDEMVHFWKEFCIPGPDSGWIRISVDDDYDLYVNGELIGSDWNTTTTYPGEEYWVNLQAGNNRIDINASDTFGIVEGVLFNLTVVHGYDINVNKTVWNGTAWVEKIHDAEINDSYRFRCEIHSICCNLTNITVRDVLSDSLEYADNAAADGVSQEPDWRAGNEFGWNFTGPLASSDKIIIEFDARVVGDGDDCNIQKATAFCQKTAIRVSDEDEACINVPPCKPAIGVNKTVLNPATGRWEKSRVAKVCDNLTFNCTIHANCCNLTNITVRDVLSDSLDYVNITPRVHLPNCTWIDRPPDIIQHNQDSTTTIEWYFDKLNKSETITIEFHAHKIKPCNNNNTQNVTAWCNETGSWVTGTSTANIICGSYVKECMPDFGQHSSNWCWVAAAANSFYWYKHFGGFTNLYPCNWDWGPPGGPMVNPVDPASINATKDGIDNDGDGAIDEDPYDGIDNDGDGMIDEDGNCWYDDMDNWRTGPDGIDNDGDRLIDEDPYDGIDNDGDGLTDEEGAGFQIGFQPNPGYHTLFRKIAFATWRDRNMNGRKDPSEQHYCYSEAVTKWDYLLGVNNFLRTPGVDPLIVHDIMDPDFIGDPWTFGGPGGRYRHDDDMKRAPTPENADILREQGISIEFRAPTYDDYRRELGRSQDVILMVRNVATGKGHVVTGVSFDTTKTPPEIDYSDPWTWGPSPPSDSRNPGPNLPDHNKCPDHDPSPYDVAKVISTNPFIFEDEYDTQWRVVDMVFISPTPPSPTPPCIKVNKTVWNPAIGRWVKSIAANVCDNLTFNCTIHAGCCNLTNITVTDILSCSLNYTNNARVHYPNGTTAKIEPEVSHYACNNTTLHACSVK